MVAVRPFVLALLLWSTALVGERVASADVEPRLDAEEEAQAEAEEEADDTEVEEPATDTAATAIAEAPVTGEGLRIDNSYYVSGVQLSQPEGRSVRRRLFLPFGLLDRVRLAPFHMSATMELGTHDVADSTASLTLHAQMSTGCSCNVGVYGTLPASIDLSNDAHEDTTVAGRTVGPAMTQPQTQLGTLDVGLFGGTRDTRESWLYRVGALLPTGSETPRPWLPSARVGDRVLELPRSAGVRLSVSKLYGFRRVPLCIDPQVGFRFDGGIDVASVVALPDNPVHIVPRAGAGMMVSFGGRFTYSLDTALSLDPFAGRGTDTRWSAGISARRARMDGSGSVLQPGITLATTRTPDGWGASVLFDLLATAPVSGSDYD